MAKNMDDHLLVKINEVEDVHWWWEGRRELIKYLLKKKKIYGRILDVGVGTGETLSFLKKIMPKAKLYGIDTSLRAVNYARDRGHKNIQKSTATKLPFKNDFFDAVLFLDVLEHINDDQKCINEAARVLKKNGIIIITSPGLNFIWSNYDSNQGHQRRYTRRRIKMMASEAGLKVDLISYFNFFLSPPIILIRLLSRLKPFEKLSSYDHSINIDLAKFQAINSLLKKIFIKEIGLLKYLTYPIGISIVAVLKKK